MKKITDYQRIIAGNHESEPELIHVNLIYDKDFPTFKGQPSNLYHPCGMILPNISGPELSRMEVQYSGRKFRQRFMRGQQWTQFFMLSTDTLASNFTIEIDDIYFVDNEMCIGNVSGK